MSDYKQILIIRTDTEPKMRKGKMVAQGAHASLGAVLPIVTLSGFSDYQPYEDQTLQHQVEACRAWLASAFTKVTLGATLDEILAVHKAAEEAGLITYLITDSGRTEFAGEPTITALAVGPDTDEVLRPITGHLRLL